MRKRCHLLSLSLLLTTLVPPALGLDEVVRKRAVKVSNFKTESGDTIPQLRLGVEAYGKLAPTRDNVVLICHFFAGDSHAAGRYPGQTEKGWWDALIGPGKPIDTDRWRVICTDLPAGMMVKRSTVVTTGPRTIDPTTGKPYGLRFPTLTVRDHVRAQKAILDQLGIRHLRAVVGPSLGGMLAWQWAIEYPAFLDVAIPVGAPTRFDSLKRWGFRASQWAIQSDPYWASGDYYSSGFEPDFGVAMALHGLNEIRTGKAFLLPMLLPRYLKDAERFDANHYLRTIELHLAYDLGQEYGSLQAALRRVRSKVIVVGYEDDDFIESDTLRTAKRDLDAAGVRNELVLLQGTEGHLSVLYDLDELAAPLRRSLR